MRRFCRRVVCGAVLLWLGVGGARAATVGFTEEFNNDLGGFGGGSQSYIRIATGGVGGGNDGFLRFANTTATRLGTRTLAPELTGDLLQDGVTGFSFWLNDVGADDDLEVHVGVGTAFSNFWLSVEGFRPPENQWAEFSVDLSDPSDWVQIIGFGSFKDALGQSDRLLFRHDLSPLDMFPDIIAADVGVDRITVVPDPSSLLLLAVAAVGTGLRRYRFDWSCRRSLPTRMTPH
ncbi:MAG: PEP-CTERM sorting domain-containing protein [Planctomycetes bacterium]|nr:PEP-CTERM sorting domain-containing protein [Planctomycetota bacterium]